MKIDFRLLNQLKGMNLGEVENLLKKKRGKQGDPEDGCKHDRINKEIRALQ